MGLIFLYGPSSPILCLWSTCFLNARPCPVGWAACLERARVWAGRGVEALASCPGKPPATCLLLSHSSRVTARNWTKPIRGRRPQHVGFIFSVIMGGGWGAGLRSPGHSCWRRSASYFTADPDPGLPSSSSSHFPLGQEQLCFVFCFVCFLVFRK